MNYSLIDDVTDFVNRNIVIYHNNKLKKLTKLNLKTLLKCKNPYLYKAKNIHTSEMLIRTILDAYLSSQEETLFGTFLESLAVFICEKVYQGKKSSAEGIDLEFDKDGIRYIVSIKSGPNWGNSSQIKKMTDNFKKAVRIIRSNSQITNIVAVNGCCYGRDFSDNGDYIKMCGQRFWEFISGDAQMYINIIEPLGINAKQHNDDFVREYSRMINLFTSEFSEEFCTDGNIDWNSLLRFNSGSTSAV